MLSPEPLLLLQSMILTALEANLTEANIGFEVFSSEYYL